MYKILLTILISVSFALGAEAAVGLSNIEKAIIEQDYKTVEKLSQKLIKADTSVDVNHMARYFLGLSYLNQDKYRDARDVFNALIKSDPTQKIKEKAQLGIYDSFYLAEEYKSALSTVKSLIKKNTESPYLSLAYLKMARAHLKLTQWKEARRFLEKINKEFPNSLEAHVAGQLLEEEQYFAVQVGSFLNQDKAEGLIEDLKNKGEYAYIVETTDFQNRRFFRVRVGRLAKLDHAKRLRVRLSSQGYPTQIYP